MNTENQVPEREDEILAPENDNATEPSEAVTEQAAEAASVEPEAKASLSETPLDEEDSAPTSAPIPMPFLSEGFESGIDFEAPKKRKMKRSGVAILSVCLTLAVILVSFLATSFFVKDVDVLHIFHPYASPEAAEALALDSFNALFVEFDFEAYFEKLPPAVRDKQIDDMMKVQGFKTREEMYKSLTESQKEQYGTFTFSEMTPMLVTYYSEEGIADFLENDFSSALFGSDYTTDDVTAIANVKVAVKYTMEKGAEAQETSLNYLVAFIDGAWYQIG
ncbi:MAG: hypothetical protein II328_00255 [Clostridia bacterium]|nr:hypothetical protein [Clostridia bacterium]